MVVSSGAGMARATVHAIASWESDYNSGALPLRHRTSTITT
jgi:hypothetical protein